MKKIPVVIPSFEPDERLIELLKKLAEEGIGPIYIVNDGSGKEYEEIFNKADAIISKLDGIVLKHEVNRGKGRALKTAFQYILNHCKEVEAVVTADSDGQHTPNCIKRMIEEIRNNKDAFVLGVRKFDLENIPWKSKFGNSITEKIFMYITGIHVSDTQTGLRGIPKKFMKELLEIREERFEFEMRMLVEATGKYQIIEVPIETIYDSKENHQTHFRPFIDSLKIYNILLEKYFMFVFSSLSSSIIDLLFFVIICNLCREKFPIIYASIATVLSRIISASYNYLVNYRVVFKSEVNIIHAAIKYMVLALLQMSCSAVLITLFILKLPEEYDIVYKVIVDTVLFILSYYIQQKIIFKNKNN